MPQFVPIDSKDSDPQYRAAVRKNIEGIVGEPLQQIADQQLLVGKWAITYPHVPALNNNSPDYSFDANGAFSTSHDAGDGEHASRWRVDRGEAMVQSTWCPPIPEYGIEEGSYSGEAYHCAWLASGRFVLWNGDGSLVQLFTRITS